jgi:signal transduction histidine kinase
LKLRLHHRYSLIIVALLLSAVVLISGATVLSFSGLFQRAETASERLMSSSLREQAMENGRSLGLLAGQLVAAPLSRGDMADMDEHVRILRRHTGVMSIRVTDASGLVLHDGTGQVGDLGRRSRDPVTLQALSGRTVASALDGDVFSVAAPVMAGARLLGAVHIDISFSDLLTNVAGLRQEMGRISDDSRTSLVAVIGSAALVLGMVGLVVGILVARGLSYPIKMLSAATRRIGQGDYDVETPTERSDEIGDLASDLRRMAAELKQTGRMAQLATVGEVAVGVAHELNQPLSTIRMAADNAIASLDDPQTDESYLRAKLDLVSELAGRMGEQIQRMCAVGRRDERRIAFDPKVSVDDALALYGGGLAAEGIELTADLPAVADGAQAHPLLVEGMPNQLTQVVVNLLANARDAIVERSDTPLGRLRSVRGRIRVSLAADIAAREFRLVVADNGGGIPAEILGRIFDPFFTTKEVNKGTGLGLSISYGIVMDMGGRIDVQNDVEGAVFTIILPMADGTAPQAAE